MGGGGGGPLRPARLASEALRGPESQSFADASVTRREMSWGRGDVQHCLCVIFLCSSGQQSLSRCSLPPHVSMMILARARTSAMSWRREFSVERLAQVAEASAERARDSFKGDFADLATDLRELTCRRSSPLSHCLYA